MAVSVGFIGVGNMGNPMASNILKNGFKMKVFDKVPKTMENLVQAGAQRAASAREVVEGSEIVLTCLPASPDVEALYLDAGGLVECAKPGTILIDLSSVLPSTPRKIEPRARDRGVHFLESPVSGGVSGARAATLAVMVGGDGEVLKRAEPVLRSIGPNIFHVGPVGAGNTVKAINNMMACVNSLAMMEGLVLGLKAGLDPMIIHDVVKASSGGSKALDRIPRAIIPRDFEPGFKVFLMNKDLETFNTIAKELHVPVSFSNVAQRYEQAAMAAGLAEKDTTLVMPPAHVVPVMFALEIVASVGLLPSVWRDVDWRSLVWIVGGCMAATPVGLAVLAHAPENLMRALVSAVVVVVALVLLKGFVLRATPGPAATFAAGCLSGLLNGSTGLAGPPAVIFYFSSSGGAR